MDLSWCGSLWTEEFEVFYALAVYFTMRVLYLAFTFDASAIVVVCLQSNIGLILHAVEEYELSLRFLEHALTLNIRYEPSDSVMLPKGRPKPVTCVLFTT